MKIADFCKTGAGGTPLKSNKAFYDGGNVPWLLSGEVGKRNIMATKNFITQAGLDGSSAKLFPENTVLIAMYGATAGEVGILRCEAATNQAVCGIYPNDNVLPEYLYYFFLNHKELLVAQAVGNAQPNISQQKIKNTEIDLPLIPEQKRIVAILDQAFADIEQARAKTEQNLKNARELFESYLQQVFSQRGEGWVEVPLGRVCNFQNGYAFKSKDTVESSNTQLIRMGNLYQNVLDLNRKSVFYPDNFFDEYDQFKLNAGDMIISLTGTVGKEDYGYTVEIPATEKNLLLNQRIAKVIDIDSEKIEQRFLLRILRSRVFLDELYSTANGTRQANLSTATMKEIMIAIPSADKQRQLCSEFDGLEAETMKLTKIYTKKLVDLDELKKSILQKAFSGELTKTLEGETSKGAVA